jgi:hypothetical protein
MCCALAELVTGGLVGTGGPVGVFGRRFRLAPAVERGARTVENPVTRFIRRPPIPTLELAKFLLAAREGVLARTVRDDGSAADTVQAVTSVISEAIDALKADRHPLA